MLRYAFAARQKFVLFDHCSHTRRFTRRQDATLDATLAADLHRRTVRDLRGQGHLDFHGSAVWDRLRQQEVNAAGTHILRDSLGLAPFSTDGPMNRYRHPEIKPLRASPLFD